MDCGVYCKMKLSLCPKRSCKKQDCGKKNIAIGDESRTLEQNRNRRTAYTERGIEITIYIWWKDRKSIEKKRCTSF